MTKHAQDETILIHIAICDLPILIGLASPPATVVTAEMTFLSRRVSTEWMGREEGTYQLVSSIATYILASTKMMWNQE